MLSLPSLVNQLLSLTTMRQSTWTASVASLTSASAWTINLPPSMPSDISQGVVAQFTAFGFEPAGMINHVRDPATQEVNQFVVNLVNEITSRTGGKAIFRVDSDPYDRSFYHPDQTEPVLPITLPYTDPVNGGETFGPGYFEALAAFPDVDFIIGIPGARTNATAWRTYARLAADAIGLDRIVTFETVNEPDDYGGLRYDEAVDPARPTFDLPNFQTWQTNSSLAQLIRWIAGNVTDELDLPTDHRIFQAFDFLGAQYGNASALDIHECLAQGTDADKNIKASSTHYYAGTYEGYEALGYQLMNHSITAKKMDVYFKDLPELHAWDTSGEQMYAAPFSETRMSTTSGLPFIFGEVGALLPPKESNQLALDSEVSVLGTALWYLDVGLYAMSLGVDMVVWQQNFQTDHDLWLPCDGPDATHTVYTPFYAAIFHSDWIGDSQGKLQTALLPVEDSDESFVAYGAWLDGELSKVAMLNLEVWDNNMSYPRPVRWVNLDNLPTSVKQVTVKQLNSPDGAHGVTKTVTWAGSQWTAESDGKEVEGVRDDTKSYNVENGRVTVPVDASSAIMICLS